MCAAPKRLLVVTDLDGTLLDDAYRWDAARDAVSRVHRMGVPLVLNSSKTLAELEVLAGTLGNGAPLVAENGGVIAVAAGSPLASFFQADAETPAFRIRFPGRTRAQLLSAAHRLRDRDRYRFEGFADWTVEEIRRRTGLSTDQALRASRRLATEPLDWQDTEDRKHAFQSALASDGIRLVRGGRFHHLMGSADKGSATREVLRIYQEADPSACWIVAVLGDSPNDLEMLSSADIAVVVPNAAGAVLEPEAPRVIRVVSPGPAGWQEAMDRLLPEFD